MEGGTPFAQLALFLIIPVTLAAFAVLRPTLATGTVLVFGLMFLPENVFFDLPVLPPIYKENIVCLCILGAQLVRCRREISAARLWRGIDFIILVIPLLEVMTLLTNTDPVPGGSKVLSGMSPSDIPAYVIDMLLKFGIPYLAGRIVFRDSASAADLLRILSMAGIIYIPIICIELFVGPKFHLWVYGYMASSLEQEIRGGGFRPMGFTLHGLVLAMALFTATVSCWALAGLKVKLLGVRARVLAWLLLVLFPFMKSAAATIYTFTVVPAVVFMKPKAQLRFATIFCVIIMAYVGARLTSTFPTWTAMSWVAKISSPERAQSLGFRLGNEETLLVRARQRPLFGWGGYARNHVFDRYGNDITITDGAWIIYLGADGILGFVARFALLMGPIFFARRRLSRVDPGAQKAVGALALIQAFSIADLLPNSMTQPVVCVIAGALVGLSWGIPEERPRSNNALRLVAWYLLRKRILQLAGQATPGESR